MYHSWIVLSVGGSVWYVVWNLRCTFTIDSVFANSNAFLFPVQAMFRHNCPLAVKPASMPRHLVHRKTWRDSLPIDMLHFPIYYLCLLSILIIINIWEFRVFLIFAMACHLHVAWTKISCITFIWLHHAWLKHCSVCIIKWCWYYLYIRVITVMYKLHTPCHYVANANLVYILFFCDLNISLIY
jgi:hypothetical protein